ncbi:unnamed protein product [Dimorphilus gyrociliatus]|uniref:Uncharacterized protein n=1 Tax=Dimorphilus gyrociliatus TaxID=2664684 RepID=A0A7I8VVK3_9ANNE|nr:unnamed protein product [Dimorphilus gyrociliatus]
MRFAINQVDSSRLLRTAISNSIRLKYDEKINSNEYADDKSRIAYLRNKLVNFQYKLQNEYASQTLISPCAMLKGNTTPNLCKIEKRPPYTPVSSPESDENDSNELKRNIKKIKKKRKKRVTRPIDLDLYQRLVGTKAKSMDDLRGINRPKSITKGHKLRPLAQSVSERLYVINSRKIEKEIDRSISRPRLKSNYKKVSLSAIGKKHYTVACQTDRIIRRSVPAMIKENAFLTFKRRAEEVIRLGSENPGQFTRNQWQCVSNLALRIVNQGYKLEGKVKKRKNYPNRVCNKSKKDTTKAESKNDTNHLSKSKTEIEMCRTVSDEEDCFGLIVNVEPLSLSDEENFVNPTKIKEIDADHCDACRQLAQGRSQTRSNYLKLPPVKSLLGVLDPIEDEMLRNIDS